jgi:hypothetical protein
MAPATITRMARLQPWYHVTAPRCVAITLAKEQCVYTARYETPDGREIYLCKVHADMADFKVKPIRVRLVALR